MRNLKPLLTRGGKIAIAALDHRGSLKKALHPDDPEKTSRQEMVAWKRKMVKLFEEKVSAILIDPVYGKELVDAKTKCGWIVSLEKSGYRGAKWERVTELLPDWSVRQAKELGAAGVKLLLYYDSDNKELAVKQRELAERVSRECEEEEMVFLLEPLSYRRERGRREQVIKTVEEVGEIGMQILKLEYPGDRKSCEAISRKVKVPWVLLSAGMEYERYRQALRVACESGASGMAVGRAVWQEFGKYEGEEREKFLRETARRRMAELTEIVEKYGKRVDA